MIPEQIREAIWVRAPTSPLIRDLAPKRHVNQIDLQLLQRPYLVMEPKAGKVPGMKELAKLPAPSATSSRLGLIECRKRAPFCFAATMLSKKPTTDIRLSRLRLISTDINKSRGTVRTWQLKWFVEAICY